MDFGRPNAEISRKMANGRLLFLALLVSLLRANLYPHLIMPERATTIHLLGFM